jgi:hypothetical protein
MSWSDGLGVLTMCQRGAYLDEGSERKETRVLLSCSYFGINCLVVRVSGPVLLAYPPIKHLLLSRSFLDLRCVADGWIRYLLIRSLQV